MRCNPKRWVWGLLPIAILTWMAALNEYDRIENDLLLRAHAALARERMPWASMTFDGRDGVLLGKGWERSESAKALATARGVWGVRLVEDRTDLPGKVESYVWSAALRHDRVKLAGFVPNEAAQKAIVGVTRAAFPKSEISDRMKLARGAPPQNNWLGGVSFALEQLSHLRRGMVYLDGAILSVTGEAESPSAYKTLKAALHGGLPAGLRLASDKVVAPSVKPYTWEARIAANQVVLSGHVPSEEFRDKLFEHAKAALPWMTLVDHTDIALGAPQDWLRAARAGLDQLAHLEDGAAILLDAEVALAGVAPDEETAERIRVALRKDVPENFKASAAVRAKTLAVETVSPFVTVVSALNGKIEMTGHAPSEADRSALQGLVAAKSPGRTVDNRLRLAAGAPTGWRSCLEAGLLALGKLGGVGRLELADRRLEISGRTDDGAVARALPSEINAAADRACDLDFKIDVVAQPEPRLTWHAHHWNPGEVILEGDVPDAGTKAGLVRAAVTYFQGARVTDRMTVSLARPGKWPRIATAGLRQLARLRRGEAVLSGNGLTVRGEAADGPTATSIREQLGREMVGGYEARGVLDIETDSVKTAERAAAQQADEADAARKKVAADAQRTMIAAEAEAERRKTEAEARRKMAAESDAKKVAADEPASNGGGQTSGRMSVTSGSRDKPKVAALGDKPGSAADPCQEAVKVFGESESIIRFERSSASLEASSRPALDKLAGVASLCPRARIEIKGHTDAEGASDRNLKLSRQRAQSVVSWLEEAGVEGSRLRAIGYGETHPAAPNDTADNRAKNRRIEFSVSMN